MKRLNYVQLVGIIWLTIAGGYSLFGQGAWTQLSPMPQAAGFMSGTAYDGKVYLFGGAPTVSSATNKAYRYDPADGSWTILPALPQVRCGAGVAVLQHKIYVIGGGNAPLGQYYKSVLVFDPGTMQWDTTTSLPAERSLFATAVLDGKIYVMGGGSANGEILKSVVVYDPVTRLWTDGPNMAVARAFTSAGVWDRRIYVLGGTDGTNGFGMDAAEVFDPEGGWQPVAALPTPRWGLATCGLGGRIFAFGGSSWDTPTADFSTVEMFSPKDSLWQAVAAMPTSRRMLTAVEVDNMVYTFGGIKGYSGAGLATNAVEKFDPAGLISAAAEPEFPAPAYLEQNVPNPFRQTTLLRFHLNRPANVLLSVNDAAGREIGTVTHQYLLAGDYVFPFHNAALQPGEYFALLRVDARMVGVRKITVGMVP